jgi:hypothetical protein
VEDGLDLDDVGATVTAAGRLDGAGSEGDDERQQGGEAGHGRRFSNSTSDDQITITAMTMRSFMRRP